MKRALTFLTITAIMLTTVSNTVMGQVFLQNENSRIEVTYTRNSEDIVMLPLLAVAESLGYVVIVEQETIIVGYGFQLQLGESHYTVGLSGIIYLSAVPEVFDGDIFVPIDFVRYALGYEVTIYDGLAIIGDYLTPTVWIATDANTVWFSEDSEYEYPTNLTQLGVGITEAGGEIFSLLRVPLRGDWLANEVSETRLFLKAVEGTPPSSIYIGTVANSWSTMLERSQVRDILHENSLVLTEVRQEADGWISLDVTDIVVGWLSGEMPNRGFALFPADEQTVGVFSSGMSDIVGNAPRLVVSAEIGERRTDFGRFGFSRQPGQGITDPMLGGNCFSYALRDLDGIYTEHLNLDFDAMNRNFFELGIDGLLEYIVDNFIDYVETHAEALQISDFRRIDGFDSPIDSETEYRIALRVAADATEDFPMNESYGFDYHLFMQLNDGRWAQTNPSMFSAIVPGTGPGIDPARFPWDAGEIWGIERWMEWYTSSAAFFAVTKDTDEFTQHMQAGQTTELPDLPLGQTTETTGEIVVNGRTIEAPTPSVSSGVIMLPLRPIAEALELAIVWDSTERRVNIGENYVIWLDRPAFSSNGGQTIQDFGPAPILIDGHAFVPLPFFNFGISGTHAEIIDGTVVIEWSE
ncbi:MAG: stalk domain-containing protein [Defluviitaleaceae bacterium]|nr:stalk domain-containing protein [Defluviitaleaceae bacterium]